MTTAHKVTVGLAIALAVLLAFAGYGWLKEHDAATIVGAQVKADGAAQAAIKLAQQENEQKLATTLAAFSAMKVTVQTPQQVAQALPQVIQLPAPIVQVTAAEAKAANAAVLPDAPGEAAAPRLGVGDLVIPAASAKAFYDAQVDCKANAAKVDSCAVTTTNLSALNASKDIEIQQLKVALKGGTKWQRFRAAMKYVAIGAAVGAGAVAYADHH